MKTISINFVDFWNGFNKTDNIITNVLSEVYDIKISEDPDYLFYGPYGNNNLKYLNCIRIYVTGENVVPDYNLCDYSLDFEYMEYGDRHLRYPNYCARIKEFKLCAEKHLSKNYNKDEFCSFVVSNSTGADSIRAEFFEKLSKYKKVNSGGRYLNNIGLPNGVDNKLEFQKKHKFAIAFENSSHEGYTTEKLIDAFAAQCVPIYWGDPLVGRVFNEKAFINVHNFESLDDVIKEIIRIDNDDDAYFEMLSQPAIINLQDYPDAVNCELRKFLFSIFEQPYKYARRRTVGLYMDKYESTMKRLLKGEKKRELYQAFNKKKHNLHVRLKNMLKR